ncbi:MAG: CARDB domain-containing protein, partial [Thermoplasmata archaeon]
MGKQEDDALKRRRSSKVLIAVTLVVPIVISSLSLFSYNGLSQSGSWTDLFDDESKIAQKSNVVISGGDVSLGASGMKWFRQGMVLDVGPIPSTYESSGWPSVVKGSDGIYRMWYTGSQSAVPVSNRYIRYATSVDGKNWNRMGIVIGPNATLEGRVYAATVIEDGGTYKMWYVGDELDPPWGSSIFYATSPDGYTWTRQGLVLPKAFEGTYDNVGVSFPAVLKDGGVYKMWYTGYDGIHYRILYATSPDGQIWTYQNLAIDVGTNPGDYEYMWAFEPAVVKDANGVYHIWYSGSNGTHFRILNATSPDGVTWTKQGLSLDVLPDSMEDVGVLSGSVIMLPSSVVTMWYEGVDSFGKVRIFRATLGGSGHVVSEAIGPHSGCDWSDFFANKTDPNADIFVSFSVLDAVDWTIIPGYWNLTDVQFSLLSIDPIVHPTIRLRADLWNLQGNFTLTPELHDWTITWTDPNPPPPDKTPPEILNVWLDGDSVSFITEGTPSVTLTATLDDSTTGGSIIGGANATSPAGAWWNSTLMNPVDILDTPVENFSLTIDTLLLSLGSYDICVYGWDVLLNYNETGACALLMVTPSPLPDIVVPSDGIVFGYFGPAPKVGQLVAVRVNTSNIGDALAENFTLVIFEDLDSNWVPGPEENISIQHISGIGPLSFNISYAMWIPMTAGVHTICAFADSLDNVTESNETNNVGCKDIEVLPGGVLTTLVVGQPNHVSDHTFITSATPLTLQVVDLAGMGVAYTEYRV